jgi:hypothetical protein
VGYISISFTVYNKNDRFIIIGMEFVGHETHKHLYWLYTFVVDGMGFFGPNAVIMVMV